MEEKVKEDYDEKQKLLRCMDWLQQQNEEDPKKLSLQNKNDIQFIIQTHAARKNFLLALAEDDATVPAGINEPVVEPQVVSLYKLRVENLQMECEWHSCRTFFDNYENYQKHVGEHSSDLQVIKKKSGVVYVCLWDVCGGKSSDFKEMVRHMNYHAYHGKLLAIGLNARATLKLARCKKDSSKRNEIPVLCNDYCCMWVGCEDKFNSMQNFLDHVKLHTNYSENFTCSWAGCGTKFLRKGTLEVHVRSHTGERLIACFHCGMHFATNRKLNDHLRRQNIYPNTPFVCELCGTKCATEYLLSQHTRQHVSTFACTLCDMSASSAASLACHMRYRHISGNITRIHACPNCAYRAITKSDLKRHITLIHKKKKKKTKRKKAVNDIETCEDEKIRRAFFEDQTDSEKKDERTYVCHMCPEKEMQTFRRGNRLTKHLVKVHGAQWSFGHSRFRYQKSKDGFYRLTTTRYESLEVSKKIMDGYSRPKETPTNLDFKLKHVADATETTPTQFELSLKNEKEEELMQVDKVEVELNSNKVEIMMCNVDEDGNIISSEVIKSEVLDNL